jgi:glycine/D-amino acid oxidase-like deaminating enzyme/nitrite reductase/ring-hydroxylating ferredoxin subunit
MKSVWTIGSVSTASYAPLAGRTHVDVAVIGAGITGVMTALMLSDAGLKVALLEAGRIGRSNTGGSTGNLYATLSGGLADVRRKWKDDVLREMVGQRNAAIDMIEHTVTRFGLDCAFKRQSLYSCVAGDDSQALSELDEELQAHEAAGLAARIDHHVEALPFKISCALRLERQAQFNPLHFVQGVARALAERGVAIHEGSAVIDVKGGRDASVRTDDGEVRAAHLVFATHTPKGFNLVQAEMEAYREHGIAAVLHRGHYPSGIFWIRNQGRSVRSYRRDEREYLVVVGGKHKTGHNDGVDQRAALRGWAQSRFDVGEVTHEWSAQQYKSADLLPYIGPSAHQNVLIATGFAADGLTWGAVAARLISERIQGRTDAAADLLTPRRFTPVKSARTWASENATVMRHLVGDRLGAAEATSLAVVAPGEGRIVDINGRKHAVYRGEDRMVTVLSPVCPHMKCHVAWNGAERSWDCPCHGSRFGTDGRVLEGPALQPLARVELPLEQPASARADAAPSSRRGSPQGPDVRPPPR